MLFNQSEDTSISDSAAKLPRVEPAGLIPSSKHSPWMTRVNLSTVQGQAHKHTVRFLVGAAIVGMVGCQKAPTEIPQSDSGTPLMSVTASPSVSITPLSAETSTATPLAESGSPQIKLDKESYFPGEQMKVTITATGLKEGAWAGVVPSSIPHGEEAVNDEHDLNFIYVDSGKDILVAPKEVGDFDVRLNSSDTDGVELASLSFKVVQDTTPITEPRILWTSSAPIYGGSELDVAFEVPLDFPSDAWIGLLKSEIEHGSEATGDEHDLSYAYLENVNRGKVRLLVPNEPGKYDLRMYDTDNGQEVHHVSFEVVAKL